MFSSGRLSEGVCPSAHGCIMKSGPCCSKVRDEEGTSAGRTCQKCCKKRRCRWGSRRRYQKERERPKLGETESAKKRPSIARTSKTICKPCLQRKGLRRRQWHTPMPGQWETESSLHRQAATGAVDETRGGQQRQLLHHHSCRLHRLHCCHSRHRYCHLRLRCRC